MLHYSKNFIKKIKKSIFSNMTPHDLDLKGTSSKVGMPVPISNTNYHVKFGMDRTSILEVLFLVTKSPEVLFLVTKSPGDLDLECTSSKVRI